MADMGLDFRAPKKSDIKAWKIVQDMYSCGCNGPGFIPSNLSEYRDYLSQTLEQYENY